jgi:hypothetical protein
MKPRWKGFLSCAVLTALLGPLLAQKLDLDKDIELEIKGDFVANSSLSYLTPFLGKSSSAADAGQTTPLIADLTFDRVMIANDEGSSYGIECRPELLCEITGFKDVCTYQKVPVYDCQSGSVLVKYRDVKLPELNIAQMTAFFYNSTEFWESKLGKHGVFGLGPGSPVWGYFDDAYSKQPGQEFVETSLSYRLKDYKSSIDPKQVQLVDSFFTVNGRAGINDPILQPFNRSKYAKWVFEGVRIVYGHKIADKQNVALCVDNTQNTYFLSANATAMRAEIFTQLCGSPVGCTRAKTDLTKVSAMQISFESSDNKRISMSVKPEEYINFDASDNAVIAIQDIGASECGAVGKNVTEGVGRLMLSKVEFVVRVHRSDKTKDVVFDIGFNEISYPKDTIFLIILIALGVVIVFIIIGIVIANSVHKKKASEEESQRYTKQREDDN